MANILVLEAGGKARLFQAGTVQDIEWMNANGVLVPVQNGVTVKLVPGKTWIHMIRTDPGIETATSFTP